MIGEVNLDLVSMCEVDDPEKAELIADYLSTIILSQAGYGPSGAPSWLEDLMKGEFDL